MYSLKSWVFKSHGKKAYISWGLHIGQSVLCEECSIPEQLLGRESGLGCSKETAWARERRRHSRSSWEWKRFEKKTFPITEILCHLWVQVALSSLVTARVGCERGGELCVTYTWFVPWCFVWSRCFSTVFNLPHSLKVKRNKNTGLDIK